MCSLIASNAAPPPTPWLDRLGIATSTLCAVHCAASALLMGALSALGATTVAAPWVEQLFLGAAVLLGVVSLVHATRRHRRWQPALFFVAGFSLLLGVRPLMETPLAEVLIVVAGAACIVRAHWKNARLLTA